MGRARRDHAGVGAAQWRVIRAPRDSVCTCKFRRAPDASPDDGTRRPPPAGTCCCDLLQRWRPPRARCMGLTVGGATLVGNILTEGQCVRVSRVRSDSACTVGRRCKHASDLTPTAERVPAEKPEHAAVCRGRGASHPGFKSPAAHRAADAQPTCH